MHPGGQLDHFCPKCGGPVTTRAAIDPLGQVFTAGFGYQRALSDKPRLITMVGMWLIFGPQVLILLLALGFLTADLFPTDRTPLPGKMLVVGQSADVDDGNPVTVLLQLLLVVGLLAIYSTILWKVTRRYRAHVAAERGGDGG
jgi:hypothetical protein